MILLLLMQTITSGFISGKRVILRYDIDVPLRQSQGNMEVEEDFRLKAGLETLNLCLENTDQVTLIGHIGRPESIPVPELSIAPILKWFEENGFTSHLTSGKLKILENLRFDSREESADLEFAKKLAEMGDVYVNEAFASYRPAVSTTVLPTLLPHYAGLNFAKEVETLTKVRKNPEKPLVVIMGGAKVEDKLPVIQSMSAIADAVLVGGKLVHEIETQNIKLQENVLIGTLTEDGFDLTPETVESWQKMITDAKMIVWNGPVGRIQNEELRIENLGSAKGTYDLAQMLLSSSAEIIVGGGDTVSFLGKTDMLEKFQEKGFISTGGGAMLKLLTKGTLPTIEALQ